MIGCESISIISAVSLCKEAEFFNAGVDKVADGVSVGSHWVIALSFKCWPNHRGSQHPGGKQLFACSSECWNKAPLSPPPSDPSIWLRLSPIGILLHVLHSQESFFSLCHECSVLCVNAWPTKTIPHCLGEREREKSSITGLTGWISAFFSGHLTVKSPHGIC